MNNEEELISIVIVNWNSGNQLSDAINSIIRYHKGLISSVIIVDNASNDNSMTFIKYLKDLPFLLDIICNSENLGFGFACNQGAAKVKSEFILFLNPDTQLYDNSISVPLAFMKRPNNKAIGICGIKLVDEHNNFSVSASRFPTLRVMAGKILGLNKLFPRLLPSHLMSEDELSVSQYVEQVIGAFFLIRKSVFDACCGFDERFFVYFEEVDLSLRAKKLGHSSYYLSEASAFHKSGGCSGGIKATRLFYSLRSRIQYAQKHYTNIELGCLFVLTALEFPLRLFHGMIKFSGSDIMNTFSAYKQFFTYFTRIGSGIDR